VVMPVSKQAQAEYQAIIQKFKAQSKQGYRGHSHDDEGGGGGNSGGTTGLEMISALRQLTSTAKVTSTAIKLTCRGYPSPLH
jgi:hypothetical protein